MTDTTTLAEAGRILEDRSLPTEERLRRLHGLHMAPETARTVGRVLYGNMYAEAPCLTGDVPALTCIRIRCGRTTLLDLLDRMGPSRIPWRLLSVVSDGTLDTDGMAVWTLTVAAWGRDRQSAETLGDVLLMRSILDGPNVPTDQPFDRWHPAIS